MSQFCAANVYILRGHLISYNVNPVKDLLFRFAGLRQHLPEYCDGLYQIVCYITDVKASERVKQGIAMVPEGRRSTFRV